MMQYYRKKRGKRKQEKRKERRILNLFAQGGPDTGVCSLVLLRAHAFLFCWGFCYIPCFIPDPSRTGCVLSTITRKRRAKRRGEGHRMDFIM
jgi:hypothetical protein